MYDAGKGEIFLARKGEGRGRETRGRIYPFGFPLPSPSVTCGLVYRFVATVVAVFRLSLRAYKLIQPTSETSTGTPTQTQPRQSLTPTYLHRVNQTDAMHPLLLLCTTAIGLTSATLLHHRQAFDPEETTGRGSNCIEAFGAGYVECVPASDSAPRLCVNPEQGEKCCNNLCTPTPSPPHHINERKLTLSPRGLPRLVLLPRPRPLLSRCKPPPSSSHSTC